MTIRQTYKTSVIAFTISLFSMSIFGQTYVGEMFYENAYHYIKLKKDSSWTFEVPYKFGDSIFHIDKNPFHSSWIVQVDQETWEFDPLVKEQSTITGQVKINGLNESELFRLYKQSKLEQEKNIKYLGHFGGQKNKIQVYERFNYLHIHSPFSKEVMSLKYLGDHHFFCVSGERFSFVEDEATKVIIGIRRIDRNNNEAVFPKNKYASIEKVFIPVGQDSVYGHVYLPSNPRKEKPGVIIFSGGTHGFDQHRLDAEIYSSLGYAVLLFDKPEVGKTISNTSFKQLSFSQKAEYYQGILNWFQNHPETQANNVGLQGGSEEGRLAIMLAAKSSAQVAFVVTISAPLDTYMETRLYAINRFFRKRQFSEVDLLHMQNIWLDYLHQVSQNNIEENLLQKINLLSKESPHLYLPESTNKLPIKPHPADVYDNTFDYLEKVRCPILFQYGSDDLVVDSNNDFLKGLEFCKKNTHSKAVLYQGINHSLMTREMKIETGIFDDRINWLNSIK